MNTSRRLIGALVLLAAPLAAMAGGSSDESPLVATVRAATSQYRDINKAIADGWVQATPCVSGPNSGAMGVHFVKPDRIEAGVLSADQPEALIYEPTGGGQYRLVGVEFIVLDSVWQGQHPGGGPPALDGNLLNLVPSPNRYGLPTFWEIHVWAWQNNPNGSYADWNTRVSCDQQPTD